MSHYEQHDDSIREENESPQLKQELYSLYDTHSADSQSLARIRSRLLQRASIPLPDKEDDNIITLQPLDAHKKREGETVLSTMHHLNEWRNAHRHWPRLVSEIAALVVIATLVGSVVLVFSLRSHTPAHTGPLPANSNGQIRQIHMIDANTGWTVVQTKHGSNIDPAPAIMRTTDGGHTWFDVTPPESLNQWGTGVEVSQAPITDFLSANTAWIVLVPVSADKTSLYFTKDGGKTWQDSLLPDVTFKNSILQMSFIDEQHGWLLTSSAVATSQDTEDVTLFQTVDSGKTWLKVSESNASRPLSDTTRGQLPFAGLKAGFTFIDAQTGWMVGQTQHANFFWFYVTHDGGKTWQHQDLPHPTIPTSPTGAGPQFQLQPPTFFGNNGVLSFTIPTNESYPTTSNAATGMILLLYVTHDGGQTWQSTPSTFSSVNAMYTYEAPQFQDATHGYFATGNILFIMQRPAQVGGWIPVVYRAMGAILQSNFVSPSTGWIIIDNAHPGSSEVNSNDALQLYQTTDGGKTWTQVSYTVMGQQVQTSQKLNKGWTAVANYSGTGSKAMFLRGQIAPSKQWWLVYSCSGTGSLAVSLPEARSSGDAPSCSATLSSLRSGSGGIIQQNALTPVSIQVQADSSTEWNVLVVECTSSQGCNGSPIG